MTTETSVNGPKKRGRPARISRRQVVGAAVDLARDVGLENVQMATVAER
ncbi:MAG: TetR/AcrR family transcriptional regulator, partial [Actinobacteria bacterium]|nr:TetR/AcrR family transcriptional regulator [Actinomycetota bacterium]